MKIKQTILVVFALLLSFVFVSASPTSTAYAKCGSTDTSVINCPQTGGNTTDPSKTGIWGLLEVILNILTAGVAVVAVGGVVYGSVLYTAAGGNAEQVKKARDIIRNTIFGLVVYALMFAFLNYLIPGGIFS
jgi:hypothetical protein